MKRWIRAAAMAGICFWLCLISGGQVRAEEMRQSLRVLVPLMNDSGFVTYTEDGFSGYYVDYLTEIAKYTGWQYEFAPVATKEELDRLCASGDFDLMTGIIYTAEYDKAYFEYPEHTVGAKRYVFAVPGDSDLFPDREYAYLRGTRIGVAGKAGENELEERFKSFCFMYGIDCVNDKEGEYPDGVNFIHIDPSSWRERLSAGEIDGILASDAFCLSQDMYAITTFGLDRIYYVAPNGKDRLIARLDDALEKISGFDPEYNDRLYEKYFAGNMKHTISFQNNEKEYLKQERVFRVAMPKDLAPYSYIDDEGNASGMITRVLKLVSQHTGGRLSFEYRFFDGIEEAADAVRSGDCDICGFSMYSQLLKRASGERCSMSFYTDTYMYYKNSQASSLRGKRTISLPELPAALISSIKADDDADMKDRRIEKANPQICLEQVEKGKSSYTVMLSHTGDYYKSYYGFSSLSNYPVTEGEVMLCLAYSPEVEQTLITVIDKCLMGVEEAELAGYVTELTMFEHKQESIGDYIKEHMELFALLLAGILFTVCALLMIIVINVTSHSRRIHTLLYQDDITGGISYKKFKEEGQKLITAPGNKLTMYINVSGFKYINDVFGYEQGNEVLREVADFLDNCLDGAIFARIYADRFVTLTAFSDEEEVKRRIEKGLGEFEEICRKKFPSFNIWVKAGVYVIKEGDDLQKAVNLANYAVDEIQKISRNDYIFYDEVMYERVLMQKEIEKDMWGAMEKGEFEAFYQPKYHIDTKQLIGAEALVRWRHPTRGLLAPGVFIPIFEKNHFIITVDFHIFECVCRFIREMMREGRKLFPISSNFSRLHLSRPDFVDRLGEIAARYHVPPEYLEIEITETVATEDFDQLITAVRKLKENGFQVSIDDFGSGYSSIQLLYKLPIDVLKFDKAFVDHEEVSELETELVDSIISVSNKNGIRIICEGVETPEQEEYVRKHNCVYVQGFLYSRPVPESQFRKLLQDR